MEKVCQKWKEATKLAWYDVKKLDVNELMIRLDKREEILEMIMTRCCQYLTHLIIIEGNHYPWMCDVLKNNCQNIIHFDIDMNILSGYKIPNEDFVQIIMSMRKLKYLRVSMHLHGSSNLCNLILEQLPDDVKEIHLIAKNITIFSTVNQFNEVAPVVNKFHGLDCLTLQGFRLTNATIESILQNKSSLVKLDLSDCYFPDSELSIFSNLKNLEQLILSMVTNFNVNEIILIARNCLKLKYFKFVNVDDIGLPTEDVPYRIFQKLRYLNFFGIDVYSNQGENQISDIENNWKQLKYLDVDYGRDFSSLDIQEITKFQSLVYLNLRGANIDSQSFINIASNCLELKGLFVRFESISEIALEKLTNLKKLEQLDFSNCRNITGNLLSKIANNCMNLVDLNLYNCLNVTEASLIQVGKLQHLKTLNICNIQNVPHAMFDDFHKLESLSCSWCPSVTDEAMIKVLDNCPKLSHLNVFKTGITVKTPVHATKRKFVFTPLRISTSVVGGNFHARNTLSSSPYLTFEKKF